MTTLPSAEELEIDNSASDAAPALAAARLQSAFREWSPRLNAWPATAAGAVLYAALVVILVAAMGCAFVGKGLVAWSIGVIYIAFDLLLLAFVAWQTRFVWWGPAPTPAMAHLPTVGVIIAAYNEHHALAATIGALLRQTDRPDAIWLADDGSDDGTDALLSEQYGVRAPTSATIEVASPLAPCFRWLRLPHRGKAHALNSALSHARTDVIVTIDADTLLNPDAIAVVRQAFAADRDLVVGGGVLQPCCSGTAMAFVLQEFQTYEYVRNFLGAHAWSRLESLLLIPGAFAAFRREAVAAVGGFDPECSVEDYELIHRLHRYAASRNLTWRIRILSGAVASTDAPGAILAFLQQRRRWFGGFLQTQLWNRDMIGSRRFGALGLAMMPIKAMDTLQPIYGLAALALLIAFGLGGRGSEFLPALTLIVAKIALDVANMALLIAAYRRWTGDRLRASLLRAMACLVLEPFSFQLLRHLGAAWGWIAFVSGATVWERRPRTLQPAKQED